MLLLHQMQHLLVMLFLNPLLLYVFYSSVFLFSFPSLKVWYGAVLRGDKHRIRVGPFSNIQDKVVINCTQELESGLPPDCTIGNHVTIGHGAVLTSCTIEDHVVIGMNAVLSSGVFVGRNSMVAAGSVVLPGTLIPSCQLWAGNPAVFIRQVRSEEIDSFDQVRFFSPLFLFV